MREHQIVITLKPEQFLQVQKLAKSAGAKSMGMFVRQQLLAALGIEGSSPSKSASDLQPVVSELKRLHFELKEFVAESLSAYSMNYDLQSETDAVSVENLGELPFITEDPGIPNESRIESPVYDEIEESANKTFAISPRLGASEVPNLSSAPAAFKSDSKPVFEVPGLKQVSQTSNEGRRDPLADLLDVNETADIVRQGEIDDLEDDTFDVPLSILARRQQLAAQLRAVEDKEKIQNKSEALQDDLVPAPKSGEGLNKPDLRDDVKRMPVSQDEKPQSSTSQSNSGTYPKYSPLENPDEDAPFSGGPPPKRR